VVKAFLSLFDSSAKALKADGGDKDEDSNSDKDSDDEDDGNGADDDDDNVIEEDEAAERDAGDWDEIAGLSRSLEEVKLLTAEDKITGRTMMKKVCLLVVF